MAGSIPLKEQDPEVYALIQKEKARQVNGLEVLTPSCPHTANPNSFCYQYYDL